MNEGLGITLKEYIERFMNIQTKSGELRPLVMNHAQNRFYDIFKEHYNEDKPMKVIILKARQMGFSTVTEAVMTSLCMTNFFRSALVVAHTSDSSTHIFDMCKRYYENLPKGLKPMLKYSNAKELRFENPSKTDDEDKKGLRSNIRVATAGQGGLGRSNTFNYIHCSELAFWEEQDGQTVADQMTGLLQTLPQHGFSMLVIESTANGYNYFKNLWDMAVRGESDMIPLFVPWFEMEEYRLPYHGETLTEEERSLKKEYDLDDEQIMWRRNAIRNLCGNDLDKFRQEYPSNPEEAFILSGRPVFNTQTVMARIRELEEHPVTGKVGMFTDQGNFYETQGGYVTIYEPPQFGHTYSSGADTAGEGSDWFVAYVVDKDQGGKMVAKYRAQNGEKMFVEQYIRLGYYYNYAMLCPETNFSTYPTMKLQEFGYLNMYVRESVDQYKKTLQKKFGFRTTSLTRPLAIDLLTDIVNDHLDLICDTDFLHEALSFIKNDKGRAEAAEGAHDDCVMAAAITYYTMPQAEYVQNNEVSEEFEYSQDDLDFINYGG